MNAYRLLALVLVAGLAGSTLAYVGVTVLATRDTLQAVNLALHRDLARRLVERMLVGRDAPVGEDLEELFETLMVVNPTIELYLLDPDGRIVAYRAEPGIVQMQRVALEPVRRFLSAQNPDETFVGDDPRGPGSRKLFSVAPIEEDGTLHGYLYVILGGELFDASVGLVSHREELVWALAGLGGSLIAIALAVALRYRVLVTRLRALAERMRGFRQPGAPEPGGALPAGDELDEIEGAFNAAAARLDEQVTLLEDTDALRREFVANVSHDLRTPLSAIQAYLDTLLMEDGEARETDPRRRGYLESARHHATRLADLVDALFELVKLESPQVELRAERFAADELAQDVVQRFRSTAADGGVELVARRAPDLPAVRGDIGLVERALVNLIENALRYTPGGGRVVVATRRAGPGVEISVSDTGPGIAPSEQARVFERFYRGRRHPRDGAGLGLGLAIARRVAELHGGTLTVESEVGSGSTFRLSLPLRAPR